MTKSSDPNYLHCEQVASLPWRLDADGKIRLLLVTSRTNAKWMLPKGWPMEGKSDPETALVETREEAGADGNVSDRPIGSYRYLKLFNDGQIISSRALVYPIEVKTMLKDWDERKQRTRRWMRPKKAADMAFEHDLKRFLAELREERLPGFHSS